jgi:hypothetical protein
LKRLADLERLEPVEAFDAKLHTTQEDDRVLAIQALLLEVFYDCGTTWSKKSAEGKRGDLGSKARATTNHAIHGQAFA